MDSSAELSPKQCSNPDCRVAQDGQCVEGLAELESCSHYGKTLVLVENRPGATKSTVRPGVHLPDADALPSSAAQLLLRNRLCNVISIVGPHESGKTSLIGGIYDLLQLEQVGTFAFAGSSTLHAFERACHDSRSASKRAHPHMERTDRGDATYFHLDLADVHGTSKRAALFANRDGEGYMDAQSNPELAKGFAELRRCDSLTVLVDGSKLLDSVERHQVSSDVRLTLRAFEEAGQIRNWQQLALVLTKIDAIRKDKVNSERALRDFDRIVADVREEFAPLVLEVRTFMVAASPKDDSAKRGEGLADLLAYWMREPSRMRHATLARDTGPSVRAFGRLPHV